MNWTNTYTTIYSELIFDKALQDQRESNIRYADDTTLLIESLEDLQRLVGAVDVTCTKYGLTHQRRYNAEHVVRSEPKTANLTAYTTMLHQKHSPIHPQNLNAWRGYNESIISFSKWCYRRMLHIPWTDWVINQNGISTWNNCRVLMST